MNFVQKIKDSKKLIRQAIKKYPKIAVACSFGKDSMVITHLARQVNKNISIFAVMTRFKPATTLKYLVFMNKLMNLKVKVYMVGSRVPKTFKENNINVVLLSSQGFKHKWQEVKNSKGRTLYEICPDECCYMLKVEPTKAAVENLDAWITGLRKTEGRTRENYNSVEKNGKLFKINPILKWTELDIWRYLALNQIPVNPLYSKGYRSLGCAPCSHIVPDNATERAGRWQNTSKCGGECGIHTKRLK